MNDDAFRLYAGKHKDGSSGCGLAAVAFCGVWWEKGVVGNAGASAPAAPVLWEAGRMEPMQHPWQRQSARS